MDLEALNSVEPLSLTEAIRFYEALGAAVTLNQPHWGEVTVVFETYDEWGNLEAVSTQVLPAEIFCLMAAVAKKVRKVNAQHKTSATRTGMDPLATAFMLQNARAAALWPGSLPLQA